MLHQLLFTRIASHVQIVYGIILFINKPSQYLPQYSPTSVLFCIFRISAWCWCYYCFDYYYCLISIYTISDSYTTKITIKLTTIATVMVHTKSRTRDPEFWWDRRLDTQLAGGFRDPKSETQDPEHLFYMGPKTRVPGHWKRDLGHLW